MKFNKFFFAAVAFAALAMVSCKQKNEPTPTPDPTPDPTEEAPEVPSIAAPGAGKTTIAIYAKECPAGAYLVGDGTEAGWNEKDPQVKFEAVADLENWYAVTIDFAENIAVKAIAIPSDEDVPLSWSYQWGKNYDPEDPGDVPEGTENTKILSGTGDFQYENNGQPKLINVADNGVVYIWVKNWAASPIIEAKKLETAWAKSAWEGSDWYWKEMTAKGDGVFELYTRWGGNGINIAETENGADAWYPDPEKIGEPLAGDSVLVTFISEKGTVGSISITLVEAGERPEVEFKDVTVTGVVPEGWEQCYIWAWYGAPSVNVFENWPGAELEIVDGRASYAFEQVGTPLSVIFSNGAGAQTSDITGITEDAEFVIADYLPAAE